MKTSKKYIDETSEGGTEGEIDWVKIHWVEVLDKLKNNLEIAPFCYKEVSEEDKKERYFTAECNCGWWGSSKFLNGGHPIADTGDYSEVTCPVCGNWDINEKEVQL